MTNGRCKRHGGKTPPTKSGIESPATKTGIYFQFLSDDDKLIYNAAAEQIGAVDHEIRLARLRLARTVKARQEWETSLLAPVRAGDDSPALVHVETVDDESVTKDGDVVPTTKKVHRLPPFDDIEHRCLARIESLEKTRKELLKVGEDDVPPEGSSARDRVTFTGGLDGGTDEELPSPFAAKPKK